jgi:putative ABC transport system substrate-binding protein
VIGALINPNFPPSVLQLQDLEAAARASGQQLVVAKASSDEELQAGLASLIGDGVGALLVASDPYFDTRRGRLIAFAAENQLPTMYQFRNYTAEGGLISYGPSIVDAYWQIGIYTARILKGAKPADLPVVQQTKFELVINLKTAKALGLTISDNLLTLADEVIE